MNYKSIMIKFKLTLFGSLPLSPFSLLSFLLMIAMGTLFMCFGFGKFGLVKKMEVDEK